MRFITTSFFVVMLLVLVLIAGCSGNPAYSSTVKKYANTFVDQINADQQELSDLFDRIDKTDFESSVETESIAQDCEKIAEKLSASVKVYQRPVPTIAPQDLKDAVRSSEKGTTQMIEGLRNLAKAYRLSQPSYLQMAENQLTAGDSTLSEAIDIYNTFADEAEKQGYGSSNSLLPEVTQNPLQWTIVIGLPLVGLAIYLLLAGFILNRMFRSRLTSFMKGRGNDVLRGKGLSRVYGVHLVVLVLFAYVLLLFSVVLIVDFGLFSAWIIFNLPRIPIYLPIALVVVVLASFWAVIRGLIGRSGGRPLGLEVKSTEEPRLWELSRTVAGDVGTRPSDVIFLSPQPGISVHEEGGLGQLLIGRTQRVLTIGAPSIVSLSVSQMRSIMAHEYGHFSNRDTSWSSLTYRAGSAVGETYRRMRSVGSQGGWIGLLSIINPGRWALLACQYIFVYVTSGFSRMREVFADLTAVHLYGADSFKEGLLHVVASDTVFNDSLFPGMIELARQGKAYNNVYSLLQKALIEGPVGVEKHVQKLLDSEQSSVFATHPPITERLAYVERFGTASSESSPDTTPVTSLFVNWNERSLELSDLLSGVLAHLAGHKTFESMPQED